MLGCRERGRESDGFFNHATGTGWVKARKGDYDDAQHVKKNQVVPMVVETFGGIARRAARQLRFCARRAADMKRGRDSTRYSKSHPRTSYLAHHTRAISGAAVFADAKHIDFSIATLKRKAHMALTGPAIPNINGFLLTALGFS